MKKASTILAILAIGVLAVCPVVGCSNQPKQTSADEEANGAPLSMTAVFQEKTESVSALTTPVPDVIEKNEMVSPVAEPQNEEQLQTPAADIPSEQPKNDGDNYGAIIGGGCIPVGSNPDIYPKVNGELDINKDGMIDSEDYKLSNMDKDTFAAKMVENGNIGTTDEAEMVISGELAVMCGIIH